VEVDYNQLPAGPQRFVDRGQRLERELEVVLRVADERHVHGVGPRTIPPKRSVSERFARRSNGGRYSSCKEGAKLLPVVEGGGPTCPGRKPPLKLLGHSSTVISADHLFGMFFENGCT
jgi:hypothetical protein